MFSRENQRKDMQLITENYVIELMNANTNLVHDTEAHLLELAKQ